MTPTVTPDDLAAMKKHVLNFGGIILWDRIVDQVNKMLKRAYEQGREDALEAKQ